ncbi:MAG: hypothetical protein U5Q44_04395 [Dehalococcoidia bacterium]|nr:hypothetical protein [Dehalococcoidia bacterium]
MDTRRGHRALVDHPVAGAFAAELRGVLVYLWRGLHAVGWRGRDEHELLEPLWIFERELHADDAAHAVADKREAVQPEVVGHADDVVGVLGDGVAAVRASAVAGAAGVHPDAAISSIGEAGRNVDPAIVRTRVAVVEEDGRAAPLLVVEQLDPVDGGVWHWRGPPVGAFAAQCTGGGGMRDEV